jgi:hypothetical protein
MLAHFAQTAVVLTLLAAPFSQASGQSPPAGPPLQGMVVLRNGEVIEGKISRYDGSYIVDLSNGRIRLKEADVDLVCSNLEEGYRRKRAVIQVGNIHDHLDLAQWCMRHNLFGLATVELADAATAEPKNPMVAALQHRLKMAMEPAPPSDVKKKMLASGPSNDELDRLVRGMPRGVVETFTLSVQPVLLNHCATSGCHGPQSETGLQLWHIAAGRPSSRRTTQRNLYSVLKFMDRENPSASKLLAAATKPHGTAQHAIFSEREASQYQHMVEWANLIAQPATELPDSVARHGPAEVTEPPASEATPARLPSDTAKARLMAAASARRRTPTRSDHAPPKPTRGAAPASFDEPVDPLDPDAFNRRYAPKK